jgi:hypothetical protein
MEQMILHGISLEEFLQRLSKLIDDKLCNMAVGSSEPVISEYLTRSEVSILLKVSMVTLHSWNKIGVLKSYKIGSRVLYKRTDIDDVITTGRIIKRKN